MKLTISPRKLGTSERALPQCEKTTCQTLAGPNQIAKRKQLNRDKGVPFSVPGTGSRAHINQIRRDGDIPAILYGSNTNELITIKGSGHPDGHDFQTMMREIKKNGFLATTIFELHDGKKVRKAIMKDIQYNVASYSVEHADFLCVDENPIVTVNVPVRVIGEDECLGIKAGGFLRHVKRSVKVTCKYTEIPKHGFTVDISKLEMLSSKCVADLIIPASIRETSKVLLERIASQPVVTIAKK